MNVTDLNTKNEIHWCPGCGNYGILMAIKQALVEGNYKPHETVVVSGIGCSGKIPHFIKTYGFESLHGRALPPATGIKLANHKLNVIAMGGDGDGYGIGAGHFLHNLRRNINITYIVHDNQIYGLTKGQTSPTSEKGFKSKSTPHGVIEEPVNPIAVALAGDAGFVARTYTGDLNHMKKMFLEAMKYKGFALVDVFQQCVSFNPINTTQYYRERVYDLQEEGHDVTDKQKAFEKSQEWGDRIPIGIFYKVEKKTYEEYLPQIKDTPLVKQDISDIDVSDILENYM